jgi:S1-C subfamily serine protease
MTNQNPNSAGANLSDTPLMRRVLLILASLNIIVFGALFVRLVLIWYFPSQTDVLLLQGLTDQRSRLEALVAGPCDSAGMESYRRGEIGPLLVEGRSGNASPSSEGDDQSTEGRSNSPSNSAGTTDVGRSPATGAVMLSSSDLRSLIDSSVVRVLTHSMSGTAFAISPKLLVTNRHVIESADGQGIAITSKHLGTEPIEVKLIRSTADSEYGNSDFAVLEIVGAKELVPLRIGDDPQPLESVVAAGYPGITIQSDSNEVVPDVVFSQGDVSVVQPQPNGVNLVIHTANIAPGSSGGPLVNRCGTLVGINTFVSRGTEFEGRALYSLSAKTLSEFLKGTSIPFEGSGSAECAPAVNQ